MVNAFIFSLDSEFLVTSVEEVKAIADSTISNSAQGNLHEIPPKFFLCQTATIKMLKHDPVNKEEILAIIDVIGGYYSVMILRCQARPDLLEQLNHAKELMRFADVLIKNVRPLWGLELVKN